jgi:TadE-like protein
MKVPVGQASWPVQASFRAAVKRGPAGNSFRAATVRERMRRLFMYAPSFPATTPKNLEKINWPPMDTDEHRLKSEYSSVFIRVHPWPKHFCSPSPEPRALDAEKRGTTTIRRGRGGNMVLEAAMWLPILFLLIVGMEQIGKITYLYYVLKKIEYAAARDLSVQPGVDFCNTAGGAIQAAIQFAITDPSTAQPLISNLTADMFQVSTICLDATGAPGACNTSGCNGLTGAQRPDFVTVSIPNGYTVQPRIPYITLNPIALAPSVTVPFNGGAL